MNGRYVANLEPRELFRQENLLDLGVPPDGHVIAIGGGGSVTLVWLNTGEVLQSLPAEAGRVTSVAFSLDGNRLAVSTFDPATLQVWDWQSGEKLGSASESHNDVAPFTLFSDDGRRIVTGSADSAVKIWDADWCVELLSLRGTRRRSTGV